MIRSIPTTFVFAGLCLLGTVSLLFSALSLATSLLGGVLPWTPAEACCSTAVAGSSLGWILLGTITVVSAVTLFRIVGSTWKHLRASSSALSLSRVSTEETRFGVKCLVLEDDRALAFCAGLLRPRVFVSRGLIAELPDVQLRAILAHEDHHRLRRDPLRHAVRLVLVDGFFLLPVLRDFGSKCVERSEIAADRAAASRNPEGVHSLAKALLAIHNREGKSTGIDISRERLDGLAGQHAVWKPDRAAVFTTLAALFALLAGPVAAAELVTQSQVGVEALGLHVCLVALIVVPLTLTVGFVWKTPQLRV